MYPTLHIHRYSQTLLLLMLTFTYVNSQNLVPNPSFEIIVNCSNLGGGIQNFNAPPWNAPDQSSPDLYNICSTTSNWSIPSNQFGYQYPHTGNGYAGAGFYNASVDYREFLQVKLDSALSANQNYCVSFYVSLSSPHYVACNNIGMYISSTEISTPSIVNLNLIPQINETAIIKDTANWALIQGDYSANGGEQYIIIGNFALYQTIDTFNYAESSGGGAYYYIDDVDIHKGQCNIVSCPTNDNFSIPNAFSPNNDGHNDFFILHGWKNCVKEFNIIIFDRFGEKVFESEDADKSWDGTYKGSPMNPAVFVFYIYATAISGEEIIRKGNISLIR